jgi:predicted nucleic acid-binding protein
MILIVDASAVGAMLFGEAEGAWVRGQITRQMLLVPSVFHFELGNTCWSKSRRHPDVAEQFLSAWLDWNSEPPVTAVPVDLVTTMKLARGHGLTFYDASYLWLAQAQASALISLDAQLVRAARGLGLRAPSPTDSGQTTPRSRN